MANECIPLYQPGKHITAAVATAVTGKTFVDISGATLNPATGALISVAPATAAGKVLGVAAFDAAVGAQVSVIGEGVVPVTAGAAITAGAEVEVGTGGKAITLASGKAVGRALTTAANNADVYVRLY